MDDLKENLAAYGYEISKLPFVVQYNKRDLPNINSVEELRAEFNPGGAPDFEAAAGHPDGAGVFDTLKSVVKMILQDLKNPQS
jgi:signal recognition particle receptor subunit beta